VIGLEAVSGVIGLVILVIAILWALLWFLVPFMLWAISSRLKQIHQGQERLINVISSGPAVPDTQQNPSVAEPVEPAAPPLVSYRVEESRNGKDQSFKIEATDEDDAAEKAMTAGIDVLEVKRV